MSPYYRMEDGHAWAHLNFGRSNKRVAHRCTAPCLPTDDAKIFGGHCGRMAGHLCDAPVAAGKTCDAPMCEHHRTNVGPDRDYCPLHATAYPSQEVLGL